MLISFVVMYITSPVVFADTSESSSQNLYDEGIADNTKIENATSSTDNAMADVLCTIIVFLQGRIARVVASAAIIVFGFGFFLGKVSWTTIVIMCIGFSMAFGAKGVAIFLLQSQGLVIYKTKAGEDPKYTSPESIINSTCPELN